MTPQLRPYQRAAVDAIYSYFDQHDGHPLLVLPTASGKSLVAAAFIQEVLAQWPDERIIILAHVRELISQNFAELSANPQAPIIRLEDAAWARLVVECCLTTMVTEAERHIAENRTQAYHQKVLRLIQRAGEAGLTRSEITRRTQYLDLRQREEILVTLVEAGEIELSKRPSDTKPATIYRAVAA
jgi:superfamily II DNA or RNA helicase